VSWGQVLDALEAFAEKEAGGFNARLHSQAAAELKAALAAARADLQAQAAKTAASTAAES
jgi:F0F1-type ATP synthase membrane subunit b/b'